MAGLFLLSETQMRRIKGFFCTSAAHRDQWLGEQAGQGSQDGCAAGGRGQRGLCDQHGLSQTDRGDLRLEQNRRRPRAIESACPLAKVQAVFTFGLIADNLVRLPKLLRPGAKCVSPEGNNRKSPGEARPEHTKHPHAGPSQKKSSPWRRIAATQRVFQQPASTPKVSWLAAS